MRAVLYKKPFTVAVEDVPEPRIEAPLDAIVRITTTNICGSDLHMYEGRTAVEENKVLGHENMGIVEEVGPAVNRVKVGDRVSVPFNISCGTCRNCVDGWTSFCLRTNPTEGVDGAAYGYANMGPYAGGQAELLRVPYADFNLLELPPGQDHERDFTMLAESIGAEAIDFSRGDPVEQITDANGGTVDRGVEAVGYQAHDPTGTEHPELVLDNLVKVVRTTGAIGVVGVYVPQDPGAANDLAKEGRVAFDYGTFFTKGQRMGTGQCPVKRYNRELRDLIIAGRATPSFLVSHELALADAPAGYDNFDKRVDGWTKVLLHP
jgi:glutathione-independent formaldehyde dehydrogenase